jgi:putative oxidoreductase
MKYVTWVLMALVSLVVIGGGVAKLMGVEAVLASFAVLGLPAFFGTFIGLAEVAGGLGIWHRKTSALAAAGLSVIMVGAIYYHIVHTPIAEGIAAMLVLAICLWIVKRRGTGVIG